ncbi:MAG: hypothetical protein A2043_08165 [Candidatus Schekmanbacteria bacterium GWA2_38_9]|uniref:DUF5615 domain-containing protein n=1 Tax=Candidatus Schekmanbacteria bacterium RIFCSPLOWO2_12_FULL_38_15 TaxID=1817883 RepID=A0A1F7SFF7_9BACT|nr:MAG: hypothetical protein A2043_08165 [Candidatus Schekmanbacteria bacterium GWA2_38_9]OGL50631.1 MAG: hypothetical protein A3H37_02180 [Candidatus Schekmanbacteria bacterium RIFCSPLOWO2_02_FULL_38_14]OGL52495.1 MAG: hypothetical protein A3G31_10940 [Candidatus Schekmanbacteria bacterium RIFCSPLOWO2_12_FULL_38_15]
MKFLLDENLPTDIKNTLLKFYPDSIDVSSSALVGQDDEKIYYYAIQNNFGIISMDSDFSNILRFPPDLLPGIIFIRPKGMRGKEIYNRVINYLSSIDVSELKGTLVVVSKSSTRIKRKK